MRLDHDRTTGGQGGSGVSAGHGKSEGEVARAKDRYRANRKLHLTNRWLARLGGIDDRPQVIALAQQRGEGSDLPGRARTFDIQARQAQPGFAVGCLQQVVAQRFNLRSDFIEEIRDSVGRIVAHLVKGSDGRGDGAVNFRFAGIMKGQVARLLRARIDAVEDVAAFGGGLAGDIVVSCKLHVSLAPNCSFGIRFRSCFTTEGTEEDRRILHYIAGEPMARPYVLSVISVYSVVRNQLAFEPFQSTTLAGTFFDTRRSSASTSAKKSGKVSSSNSMEGRRT